MTIAARHTSAASRASVVTGLPEGFSEIAGSCNPIRINSIEFNKKVRTFHAENGCKRVLGEVSPGSLPAQVDPGHHRCQNPRGTQLLGR